MGKGALASVDETASAYYSSLSNEEVREQAEWGDLALGEFPAESSMTPIKRSSLRDVARS